MINFPNHHLHTYKRVVTLITLMLISVNLGLSSLEGYFNADAIVPILSSLLHWTPFYWGQSRFGMVVPLTTSLISNPLWNLFLQTIICSFLGLLALFCMAHFLFGSRYAFAIGALSALGYLALLNQPSLYEYVGPSQPYAPALGLAFAGLYFFETDKISPRVRCLCRIMGIILLAGGFWVTPSLIVTLGPLIVLRDLLGLLNENPRHRYLGITIRTWSILGISICCFSLSISLTMLAPFHANTSFTPVNEWLPGMQRLAVSFGKRLKPDVLPFGYAICYLICVALLCLKRDFEGLRIIGSASLCILAAVICDFFFVSTNTHVAMNGYEGRYLLISRNLLFILCSFVAVVAISRKFPSIRDNFERVTPLLLGSILILVTIIRFGLPSAHAARESVLQRIPDLEPQIMQAGCTHMAGSYWRVWPLVWRILLERYERGEPAKVWGVTVRSDDTQHLWSRIPWNEMRICGLKDDKELDYNLGFIGVTKARISSQGDLLRFEPSIPLLYDLKILPPRKINIFPQLPGPETAIRGFRKGDRTIVLFIFPNEEIYRYDIVDSSGKTVASMLDAKNEKIFKPITGRESVDFGAYGLQVQK